MDPTIDAFREVLDESLDEFRRGIDGLTVGELNARPAGGETNSIAVIVTHALGATMSWLSLGMGAPLPPRDRDAEFLTVADSDFPAWTEDRIARCLAILDDVTWDPRSFGRRIGTRSSRSSHGRPPTRSHTRSHTLENTPGTCT